MGILKFSMFVSYTWQYFANSYVLYFPFLCICCSTSERKKADKVVKAIGKLQNTHMENYFKPFWKILFHSVFPWWLLRSSLCQDTSLEELMGLRNLFSPTTFQELIRGEMHLGWVLNVKYTPKKRKTKPPTLLMSTVLNLLFASTAQSWDRTCY